MIDSERIRAAFAALALGLCFGLGWTAPALGQQAVAAEAPPAASAAAEDGAAPSPPRAADAVALIPTADFVGRVPFTSPTLSPDGSRFALFIEEDERNKLVIYDAATRRPSRAILLPENLHPSRLRWAGPDKILVSVRAITIVYGVFPVPVSRLFAFDLASGKTFFVGREKQGLTGDDVIYTDPAGEFILLSSSSKLFADAEVHKVFLDGSEFDDTAVRVQKRKGDSDTWFADNEGVVRLGIHFNGKRRRIWYRSSAEDDWDKVASFKYYDDAAEYWNVISISAGSDIGYIMARGDGGRIAVREFDFRTGEPGRTVYEHADWDLESAAVDSVHGLLAVSYTDDRERTEWIHPELAKWQGVLEEALGGAQVTIRQWSAGLERMVVWTGSEADPGALYIFTPAEMKLDLFTNLLPTLDHTQLARSKAVTYAARDGTKLRAYLTLPRGLEAKNLPLIVLPHGGPFHVRDMLAYHPEVQLLANRGYAVLQPNFRGSSGYGEAFEKLGYGEIGRGMQDDLDDARGWAIAQGYADPARVCMVGGSYGGYAAVWSVVRNPDLYVCAASWAGVTDWKDMLDYDKDFLDRRDGKRWTMMVEGEVRKGDLDEVSPREFARRIGRPLLLAHGKKDDNVPFKQHIEMMKAIDGATHVEELVLDKAGHSLVRPEDEQAWYDRLLAFLAKHNPSARNPAPAPETESGAEAELASAP